MQTWDSTIINFISIYKPKVTLNEKALSEIKPPKDGSTYKEIEKIIKLKKLRNKEVLSRIQQELTFCGFAFSGYRLGYNPKLDFLVAKALLDVSYYIFKLKHKFQRIRPVYLDKKINNVISNPAHAAFPSGHGGQSSSKLLAKSRSFILPFLPLIAHAERKLTEVSLSSFFSLSTPKLLA